MWLMRGTVVRLSSAERPPSRSRYRCVTPGSPSCREHGRAPGRPGSRVAPGRSRFVGYADNGSLRVRAGRFQDGAEPEDYGMSDATERLDKLPAPVQRRIDELKKSLTAALGNDLACLLIHGSAARGEYREGHSDIDLMVVLKEASGAELAAIANPLQLARYAARIETMILTSAEIPRAADVFPLLYDDIRRCHILLAGENPFATLTISDRHRRLRIEQELREAQIRLRRAVVDAQGADEVLGGAIFRKLRQLRGSLWALLALRGREVGDGFDAVIDAACSLYEVDAAPLRNAREAPDAALAALSKLLAAAVEDVDRMDDGGAT